MAAGNWTTASRRTVIGYFSDGEDAYRAINDLLGEGFRPSEIGAAFQSPGAAFEWDSNTAVDQEIRPAVGPNAPGAGSTASGAASDSSAVTPAGLSTGGGTVTSGAERPGPIPGGEIPSGLPHSIPSTIPSTLHSSLPHQGMAQTANAYPATGGIHEAHKVSGWWEKLTHVFGDENTSEHNRRRTVADKTSSFGTGEGHPAAYPEYDYAYSSEAFESAFFGMGIPSAQARELTSRIGRGGAIVTVDAGAMTVNAEQILERNHGSVRYEQASAPSSLVSEHAWEEANGERRVQLFGRVQHVYPGYVSSSGSATRKAS
jgi:hypothetical protein